MAENIELDPKKLKEAIEKEELRSTNEAQLDDRKREYNVSHDIDVTEEEMEAYRLKKRRTEDPLMVRNPTSFRQHDSHLLRNVLV